MIALDAATGAELWRAHIGSPGEPVAAAAGPAGVAVVTSTVLTLRSLDAGSVLATRPLPGGALTGSSDSGGVTSNSLIVSGQTIAVVASDSELTAYDPALSPRWHQHIAIHQDPAALQLATAGDAIYTIDQTADPTSGC